MITKCLSQEEIYVTYQDRHEDVQIAVGTVQTTATADEFNISSGVKTIK
jgi:hypothetical protein